jgi:hypothetical protein
MAVKLFRWPGPEIYPTEGVQPEKKSVLPNERIRSFFISFPTLQKSVEAIQEMGKSEIAGLVMKFTPWDFVCWGTKSYEEFWEVWERDFWKKQRESGHMVWVELWGFASEKQVDYEEKVLKQIIDEHGGELVPEDIHRWLDQALTPNAVRDTYRNRFTRMGGRVAVVGATMDSLYDVLRSAESDGTRRDKYTPPFGDMGKSIKFWPFDFGRLAWTEVDSMADKSDEFETLWKEKVGPEEINTAIEEETAPTATIGMLNAVGPNYYNAHLLFGRIKEGLDPNNLANPTRIINMDRLSKKEGERQRPGKF